MENTSFKNDQLVNLIEPENEIEQMLIFKVIDDSDQNAILCQATNSTLKLPPVESFHHSMIEQWYPCMSDTDENGDINFEADIHNPYSPRV